MPISSQFSKLFLFSSGKVEMAISSKLPFFLERGFFQLPLSAKLSTRCCLEIEPHCKNEMDLLFVQLLITNITKSVFFTKKIRAGVLGTHCALSQLQRLNRKRKKESITYSGEISDPSVGSTISSH